MPTYTINCVGFDSQEQASISAILDLAHSTLNSSWKIIDEDSSDVIIFNLDSEDGQKIKPVSNKQPDYCIIIASEETEKRTNDHWFLRKRPHAPPSLKELTHLLNQIEFCLNIADGSSQKSQFSIDKNNDFVKKGQQQNKEVKKTAKTTLNLDSVLDDSFQIPVRKLTLENYLFGLLLESRNDKKCRVIKSDNGLSLYLSPKKNNYYFSGTEAELLQLCLTDPKELIVEIISSIKLNQLTKKEEKINTHKGLDALIGYAIFNASQGRLLEGHSAEQPVKLVKVPDIKKIPILREYQAVSKLLTKQGNSLLDIVEKLQVKIPYIFDYYNICYLLGYLKQVSIKTKPITHHPSKKTSSFFDSLFKK